MDELHKTYIELRARLLKLTNQEVVQLAGMVLRDSCFTLDPRWLEGMLEELDLEQYEALIFYIMRTPGRKIDCALPKT